MHVLVTGGAGFVGSYVARRLAEAGYEMTVVDDLSQGARGAVEPAAVFYQASVGDYGAMREILDVRRIDAVMHYAGATSGKESVAMPALYYERNLRDGLTMLAAMRAAGVRRLIYASSAAVYGEAEVLPADERAPLAPMTPYARSKLDFERAIGDYAAAGDLAAIILRHVNIAGASPDLATGEWHDRETHLVPRCLRAAAGRGDAVPIHGTDYPTRDGTCLRDFVHVEDVARAHLRALRRLESQGGFDTFNVGNGHAWSVREVIDLCRRVTERSIPTRDAPRRLGDAAALSVDSSRLRDELGWEPVHPDLETMIRHAWGWLRVHPDGYRGVGERAKRIMS